MIVSLNLDVDGFYVLEPNKDPVFHERSTELPLPILQDYVGGYIQVVLIRGKAHGVVNEEGKIKGYEYNPFASALYGNPHDHIVGTMVVCCGKARLK